MAASFFWYDLETSGTNPRWDRVVQIAGCRTDMDLNPIGDELCTYVQLPDDVLPNPEATLVTGITPALTRAEGISEWQAAGQLHAALAQPGTCALGYNSLRFDDEFVRYLLYRNFRDPYQREWQGGNSRWDLLDLVRATGALRREGIHWPVDADGLPVYRLEALTTANGLEHGQAHDAMSDVRATIAMAQLIRRQQPRLFDYHFSIRSKKKVRALLEPIGEAIRVHVSGMYPRQRFGCAPILSLAKHPTNNNSIIVFDLLADDSPLHELSAQALCDGLLGDDPEQRPGLKEVRLNRCPFIAPLSVLTAENQARLNIDLNVVRQRAERLRSADLARKIGRVYQLRQEQFNSRQAPVGDPDAALYDGFLRDDDRSRCSAFVEQVNAGSCDALDFDDPRLYTLAERLKARQFPELLYPEEQQGWQAFVAAKLYGSEVPWLTLPELESRLEALAQAPAEDPQRQAMLLTALADHCAELRQTYSPQLADGAGSGR